jgi:hypothetical protein
MDFDNPIVQTVDDRREESIPQCVPTFHKERVPSQSIQDELYILLD